MKTYYASRFGDIWHQSANWEDFLDWCHKNETRLEFFQLYTSDAEGACNDPSCWCNGVSGFTEWEEVYLEEAFGILV